MRCLGRGLVLALLLAVPGCNVWFGSLAVPQQVWAGQVFEVVITGYTDGQSGSAGAILQLPDGFVVEGAVALASGSSSSIVQNGGMGTAWNYLMTPEPGHHLVSFVASVITGLSTPSSATLKVYVRAPGAAGGPFTFKAVAAGSGNGGTQVTDPAGATAFAAITAAPYVQTTTVVGDPVTPFVVDTTGLLTQTSQGRSGGVALGDLDGDGSDDLAQVVAEQGLLTWGYVVSQGPAPGTYAWRSRPGGPWQPIAVPPAAAGSSQLRVALGDFDGDGHLDLADTAGRVLFGNGGTGWTPGPTLPLLIPEWGGVAVGDVDGDGLADVAFSAWRTDAIQVFRSNGDRTFTEWSNGLPIGTNGPAGADQLRLVDVTGEGRLDIVAAGSIGGRVWIGDGTGTWIPATAGLPTFGRFAVADFGGVGRPALAVAGASGAPTFHQYQGGAWSPLGMPGAPLPPSFSGTAAMTALDHDRDGFPDLVVAYDFVPQLLLVPNLGGQSWGTPLPLTTLLRYAPVVDLAVGDVDGDSWPDLAAAAIGEHPMVFRNTGSGLSPFGTACAATGQPTPRTAASGLLQRGSGTFAFELQNAAPGAAGLLWIGLSRRYAFGQPVLPYGLAGHGAPGCTLWASTEAPFFLVADAAGRATVPLPIPNDPLLQRAVVFAQAAAAVPGANALGWLFAGGLAARVP